MVLLLLTKSIIEFDLGIIAFDRSIIRFDLNLFYSPNNRVCRVLKREKGEEKRCKRS